jgi:signal transduction histidine kinase
MTFARREQLDVGTPPKSSESSIEVARVDVSEQEAALRGLARGGRYVVVRVRDTGLGIAPEALDRVFEPFFSTKRERGGTGLGLSMVRWFAENCGGCAAIDSVVCQGTTVTLLLAPAAGRAGGPSSVSAICRARSSAARAPS